LITFQEETLNQGLIEEAKDILKLHSEELNELTFSLNPDWSMYQQLANNNVLHVVTARDCKKLVGYYVSIIYPHLHYKGVIVAENDLHYLLSEYRKGWAGYKFLKYTIQLLKERNVDMITHSMTVRHSYLPLAERLGFSLIGYKLVMEV